MQTKSFQEGRTCGATHSPKLRSLKGGLEEGYKPVWDRMSSPSHAADRTEYSLLKRH